MDYSFQRCLSGPASSWLSRRAAGHRPGRSFRRCWLERWCSSRPARRD